MRHELGDAYEPIGAHGMSLRRACGVCGEIFSVQSPDEEVRTKCPGPAAGAVTSDGVGEPPESSSSTSKRAGRAGGPPTHPMSVQVSLVRLDGLSSTWVIDGEDLKKARYPWELIRGTFEKMLQDFRHGAEQVERMNLGPDQGS